MVLSESVSALVAPDVVALDEATLAQAPFDRGTVVAPSEMVCGGEYSVLESPESYSDRNITRLLALGLVTGTDVQVHRCGDPMILSFRGTKIGVGREVLGSFVFKTNAT